MILPCGVTQRQMVRAQSAMLLLTDMLVFGAVHMLRGADVIYQGAGLFEGVTTTSAVGRGGKGLCFNIIGPPGEGIWGALGRGGPPWGGIGHFMAGARKGLGMSVIQRVSWCFS